MHNGSTWTNTYTNAQGTPDPLIGFQIDGRYVVEKELGHGGVGAVYLARDLKLHAKAVVVKVLLENSARNEWTVQKFLQEKEALARVDHPGVVGVLDTGELPTGKPYIVMQFVDGVSLRTAISETTTGMDLERIAELVKQIGSALSAVHNKRIFHRDLKPENIMVQSLGHGGEQVKIVDFGIAKIKESVIAPSTVTGAATAGTLVYMSPEQLYGLKVTAASDIYSFGVIVYEMVTGRRPFNPDGVAHLADLQRQGVTVLPSHLRPRLPKEAEMLILKAVSVEPKDRPPEAAEFGETLADALLSEGETMKPALESTLPATLISPSQTLERPVENVDRSWRAAFTVASIVLGLTLLSGAAAVVWWFTPAGRTSLANIDKTNRLTASERSLIYSLTVQRMREGQPYREPFQSSGQEIYENGYKFRLNVSSAQSGYLYVFNEGADNKTGGTTFTILYPTPATNNGNARLDSNTALQTNWNVFGGEAGTEHFWMVWSAEAIPQLESAKDAAFKSIEGAITSRETQAGLKQFLLEHSTSKPQTIKDTVNRQTSIRADGDVLVSLLELEHR